jgi:transposase
MSGKRCKYTPEFREQAARLVIETGRSVAHRLPRSVSVNNCWGVGCNLQGEATSAGDTGAVMDADERVELERLRRETANYVWTACY